MPGKSIALAVMLCVSRVAAAEVVEVVPSGFLIRHVVTVDATPEATWKALIDVGNWWNPVHSYSGSAANMFIDPRPGGCFCEKLPNGGGVSHMTVVYASPVTALRMVGGLGPLQGAGLTGSMTWRIVPAPPGVRLDLTYSVGG
jgi:hypothetical protein